jgi:hypothetical protein
VGLEPALLPSSQEVTTRGTAMATTIDADVVFQRPDNRALGDFLLARIAEEESGLREMLAHAARVDPVLRRVVEGAVTACLGKRELVLEHANGHPHGDPCELLLLLAAGYDGHLDLDGRISA